MGGFCGPGFTITVGGLAGSPVGGSGDVCGSVPPPSAAGGSSAVESLGCSSTGPGFVCGCSSGGGSTWGLTFVRFGAQASTPAPSPTSSERSKPVTAKRIVRGRSAMVARSSPHRLSQVNSWMLDCAAMVRLRAVVCVVVPTMCACSFDSGGAKGGASAEIGTLADDDGDGTSAGEEDTPDDASMTNADDDAPEDGGVGTAFDDDTTGSSGDHPAVLVFVESPAYDFMRIGLGTSQPHVVTLHNTGGRIATGIVAAIAAPYGWNGGAWPGTGGTCIDTLAPDGYCQIELAFTPSTLGPAAGTVVIDYDDGDGPAQAVLSLVGAGTGSTGNLLQNGDAEASGAPPPGWTESTGNGWTTTTGLPRTGVRSMTAGESGNGEVVMYQPVDISQWTALIDARALSIAFRGWSRSWDVGNDAQWFRVDFVNESGTALETFTGAMNTSTAWAQTMDTRYLPAGTRAVVVRLHCSKSSGTVCDGYFDDMSVVASYP